MQTPNTAAAKSEKPNSDYVIAGLRLLLFLNEEDKKQQPETPKTKECGCTGDCACIKYREPLDLDLYYQSEQDPPRD